MHALESGEARCRVVYDLNQFLRRLRQYQSESQWIATVLESASRFVQQVAIFGNEGGVLRLRGQLSLNIPENLTFPTRAAGAFQTAIETKDPVIALRTIAEVTEHLSAPEPGERALIIPILNGPRVVALLFAPGHDQLDLNALELIGGMASLVLERQSNLSLHAQIGTASTASF